MTGKLLFATILFNILASTMALTSSTRPVKTGTASQPSEEPGGFLIRNGSELSLNGQRFRAVGANHADLIWSFINASSIDENGTRVIEDAANCQIKVLRFSATGCGPDARQFIELWNEDSETFWGLYDQMVKAASKNHIYLLPVLVWTTYFFEPFSNFIHSYSYPPDNKTGVRELIRDLFSPDSSVNDLFKRFVMELVSRYKNSTTILMWEIGNELNLTCDRGEENYTSVNILLNFLNHTANCVRGLDPNHMVGSGMGAPAFPEQGGTLEEAVHSFSRFNECVDVASIHMYPDCPKDYSITTEEYMLGFLKASTALRKPMIIGEFGDNLTACAQSQFILQTLESVLLLEISLSLAWEWEVASDRDESRQAFNIEPEETAFITNILKDYSILTQAQYERQIFNVTYQGLYYVILTLSNSTASNLQLNAAEKTIKFNVTGEIGTGICRVSIPDSIIHGLWQDDYSIFVSDQPPYYVNSWTDDIHTHIQFIFQYPAREVTLIWESPTFLLSYFFSW